MHQSFRTLFVVVSVSPQAARYSTAAAQADTSFRAQTLGSRPRLTLFDIRRPKPPTTTKGTGTFVVVGESP